MRTLLAGAVSLIVAAATPAAVVPPGLTVETVIDGFIAPSAIAFIGDQDFLVQQQLDGKVFRVLNGVMLPDPVLDLSVATAPLDRGLLGIAVDPEFPNQPYVYVHYVEADADGGTTIGTRVTRFRWNGAALVEPLVVLTPPIYVNKLRIGGIVAFGPDDMLYSATGDVQQQGKLQNHPTGADPDGSSVIVRIHRDGTVPPDNPFAGSTGPLLPMRSYYAYGLRNTFGMAFDPVSGELWDTENGQGVYDEINLVYRGFNSGWDKIQGPDDRDPNSVGDLWMAAGASYSDPKFSWMVPVAPTSIAFIQNPLLGCGRVHDILVAHSNCGTIQYFRVNAQRTGMTLTSPELADLVADNSVADQCDAEQSELAFGSDFGIVTDMETGPDGLVYVVSSDLGTVFRIKPNLSVNVDGDGDGVADTCDCNPAAAGASSSPVEVPRLRLAHSAPTQLQWNDQRAAFGSATTYSLASGLLSQLAAGSDFAAACSLGTALGPNFFDDPRSIPPVGDGFYYLVRAGNACNAGTYGNSNAVPDRRDALDAALLPACSAFH